MVEYHTMIYYELESDGHGAHELTARNPGYR